MAVAGITANYTGRKRDISVFQYPDASKADTQTMSIKFGKNARFCTGVQKLLQRYAIILLTNLNSQEKYPDFGTELLYTLKAGINPLDQGAASQIFNLASYDAVSLIKADQSTRRDVPLDEYLQTAALQDISLVGDSVSFSVLITTGAGEAVDFIIPLPK